MRAIVVLVSILHSAAVFAAKPESVSLYLDIQESLAGDSMQHVAEKAAKIASLEKGTSVAAEAAILSKSNSIDDARKAFASLSEKLISSTAKANLGSARQASCPIAKARWLQRSASLQNPYYGSSMLECGSFK